MSRIAQVWLRDPVRAIKSPFSKKYPNQESQNVSFLAWKIQWVNSGLQDVHGNLTSIACLGQLLRLYQQRTTRQREEDK
jgi:hypothetical protein